MTAVEVTADVASKPAGWSFKITAPALFIGGVPIARLEVAPASFTEYVETVREARRDMARDGAERVEKYLFRAQLRRQLQAYDAAGKRVKVTDLDIMQMHPRIAGAIQAGLRSVPSGPAGEVLPSGDGCTAPLLYKLGTPFVLGKSKGGEVITVTELEFHAPTMGAIEAVMFEEWRADQAYALLRDCCKPVGANVLVLPEAAIAQISEGDGFAIMADVVPRFFEPLDPSESEPISSGPTSGSTSTDGASAN